MLVSLVAGQRVFVKRSTDARWEERLLLAKRSQQEWAVARPQGKILIENLGTYDELAVLGPRGGLPRVVCGQRLLRFDEDELEARAAELQVEGEALVAADSLVPAHGYRLGAKTAPSKWGPLPCCHWDRRLQQRERLVGRPHGWLRRPLPGSTVTTSFGLSPSSAGGLTLETLYRPRQPSKPASATAASPGSARGPSF